MSYDSLNYKIKKLEKEIAILKAKMVDISKNVEEKQASPHSKVGDLDDKSQNRPSDITTGLGQDSGGNLAWNDSEQTTPPYGQKPTTPTKGYHGHSHSRYAGGAMDINILELVEYDIDWDASSEYSKHSQQFWVTPPPIKKIGEVEKIGNLDIEFDTSTRKWVAGSRYIDVEKTYLVQYEWINDVGDVVPEGTEGATKRIKQDENGEEMKSPLLYTLSQLGGIAGDNENLLKSNVIWDKDAKCWRFYGVFKPLPEEE